jgi:phosphoglycolate phosphatase
MVQVRIYDRSYRNIKALIFDKDGTLARTQDCLAQLADSRFEKVLAVLTTKYPSLQINPEGLKRRLFESWGVKSSQVDPAGIIAVASRRQDETVTAGYLTPLGLGWIEALQLVEEAFEQVQMTPDQKSRLTPPIDHLAPQLQRLRQSGLKLAILSSDTDENVRSFVTTWNLASYFDLLMGEQPGLPKPNPKLLHLACDRLQVRPDEVLMLGDSAADIQLGKLGGAAGTIAYTAGWPAAKEIPHADQRLWTIEEIQIVDHQLP